MQNRSLNRPSPSTVHYNSLFRLTVSGLLIAIGIIIPMFSPLKIILEPASFTLASHVPIFIAMMIDPVMAVAVAVGTTIGFFMGGFPIVVVLRAASHLVFALAGACWLRRFPQTAQSPVSLRLFSFVIAVIHSGCELVVVSLFYFGGNMSALYYEQGFAQSVMLLVGLGSVVHSMVDLEIALPIVRALTNQRSLSGTGGVKA